MNTDPNTLKQSAADLLERARESIDHASDEADGACSLQRFSLGRGEDIDGISQWRPTGKRTIFSLVLDEGEGNPAIDPSGPHTPNDAAVRENRRLAATLAGDGTQYHNVPGVGPTARGTAVTEVLRQLGDSYECWDALGRARVDTGAALDAIRFARKFLAHAIQEQTGATR